MQREKRRMEVHHKMRKKYEEFCGWYREAERRLREKGDVPALREELRKKDKELVVSVERLSTLEGALKRKDEELELSRGIEAQFHDLQGRVDQLQGQLSECQFKVDGLWGR